MELVPEFVALLQALSATMTGPTFASLTTVLTGWIFASRRTVTGAILAAGAAADKHSSSYHRLFSAARWSLAYRGRSLTIIWDRTGARYSRGAGLGVWVDGVELARSPTLKRIAARLPRREP